MGLLNNKDTKHVNSFRNRIVLLRLIYDNEEMQIRVKK